MEQVWSKVRGEIGIWCVSPSLGRLRWLDFLVCKVQCVHCQTLAAAKGWWSQPGNVPWEILPGGIIVFCHPLPAVEMSGCCGSVHLYVLQKMLMPVSLSLMALELMPAHLLASLGALGASHAAACFSAPFNVICERHLSLQGSFHVLPVDLIIKAVSWDKMYTQYTFEAR